MTETYTRTKITSDYITNSGKEDTIQLFDSKKDKGHSMV